MSLVHPDRLHAAEMKLAEDPHDIESWQMLIKNAQCRGVDDARETYERLVSVFPTSGRYWKTYIEQEVSKSFIKDGLNIAETESPSLRSCQRSSLSI